MIVNNISIEGPYQYPFGDSLVKCLATFLYFLSSLYIYERNSNFHLSMGLFGIHCWKFDLFWKARIKRGKKLVAVYMYNEL